MTLGGGGSTGFFVDDFEDAAAVLVAWAALTAGCLGATVEAGLGRGGKEEVAEAPVVRA